MSNYSIKPTPSKKKGYGHRNGGRKKGQITAPQGSRMFTIQSYRERFKTLPLEFLLMILNNTDPDTGKKRKFPMNFRVDCAMKAAPFIHPRLSAIVDPAGKAPDTRGRYALDVTRLSDAELLLFEQLMLKAGTPMLPPPSPPPKTVIDGEANGAGQ